jgi:glycosyltransferase involved in cell wall biosynthesis
VTESSSGARTVLHLIETVGIGGAERVLLDLVRTLDRNRWRCAVVVPCPGWLLDRLNDEGIETAVLGERGSFDPGFFMRVLSFARHVRADIIHSHLFGSAVRAGLLARVYDVPAIATIHGQVDVGRRERYLALKYGIVRHGIGQIVFVSEPLRDASRAGFRFPPGGTSVIHNGVDLSRFAPRRERAAGSNEFVVGTVARLHPVKGLEVFLEAAALLNTMWPGYRFVVAGDGDAAYTRSLMQRAQDLGLANLHFSGFCADVPRAMHDFDLFALTSRSEGFSLTTIEAMASGVPVVATRCGGPELIIEDGATGRLVENGSAAAVAAAIDDLRRNPGSLATFAAAARERVMRRYTLGVQVDAYEAAYEGLLAKHRRGRSSLARIARAVIPAA